MKLLKKIFACITYIPMYIFGIICFTIICLYYDTKGGINYIINNIKYWFNCIIHMNEKVNKWKKF